MILDTHILLWILTDDPKLSSEIKLRITSSPNDIYYSPISIWEIMILEEKGRITLSNKTDDFYKNLGSALPFMEAPINTEIARLSRTLEFNHADPADRFIAATAFAYKMPLATVDKLLTDLDWLETLS